MLRRVWNLQQKLEITHLNVFFLRFLLTNAILFAAAPLAVLRDLEESLLCPFLMSFYFAKVFVVAERKRQSERNTGVQSIYRLVYISRAKAI